MIRFSLFLAFFGMLASAASGQTLRPLTTLSNEIGETSGLLYLDGKLYTHNDSGGSEKIYEFDPTNGEVVDDVFVLNVSATDWEDLCADEEFIYVGDFGNNDGTRTNLEIYKIPIADFLDGNGSAEATELDFNYSDQIVFDSRRFLTNYDAETLISYGDSLLIFSKSWGNRNTSVYALAKDAQSEQELGALAIIPVQGLITGGVYDEANERIVLVGYDIFESFVITIETDGTYDFLNFPWTKHILDTEGGSTQIEGVSLAGDGTYYLSGERTDDSDPTLYSFSLETTVTTERNLLGAPSVYPNPAKNELRVGAEGYSRADLFDLTGKLLMSTSAQTMDVQNIPRGLYTMHVYATSGSKTVSKIVLQ